MKYFVTGHTGFKGAWLTLLLRELGHEVHGYSLDPIQGSLFERANLGVLCASDTRADIRDSTKLSEELSRVSPDVIVHLAAQPLVRYGYEHPEETFTTNIDGTLNVLSSAKKLTGLLALLVITTDKVYANTSKKSGYVETDPLGGFDPYSASKAAADILAQSWSHTFPKLPLVIARAGNVLGGGDISQDRLVPDLVRAFSEHKVGQVRNPNSVRPWQHVLDCLSGYLSLVEAVVHSGTRGEWNFGPASDDFQTVSVLADLLASEWGRDATWEPTSSDIKLHEDDFLVLDSRKAQQELVWSNKYGLRETVSDLVNWEMRVLSHNNPLEATRESIEKFLSSSEPK
jgi:CDP-glucose 4,6-dehydratase